MSIGKQITEQLRQLADGARPALGAEEYHTLAVPSAPVSAKLSFFDYDRYSVTMRDLTLGSAKPVPGDARTYLSATAAAVARGLSFLEEPLAVWELDGGERKAELRSSPPLREGEDVSYWEVALWAGDAPGAQVARYHWAPGMAERELVAYPATFAFVARLAEQLAQALSAE